jgi:hypothetical protein
MAVFPQKEFSQEWSRFYDLEIVPPCLDGIMLMCHDRHAGHTGPGPVKDLLWAEQDIKSALKRPAPDSPHPGIPATGTGVRHRQSGGRFGQTGGQAYSSIYRQKGLFPEPLFSI